MTKQELKKYRWLVKANAALINRLEALQSKAERVTHALSQTPGRGRIESWEDVVVEIAETANELYTRVLEEAELMRRIEKAVASLPERERGVIEARYIDGKTWEQIAVEFSYSWRQTHYIHAAGLKRLYGKFGK